jgi:hypothetical protein
MAVMDGERTPGWYLTRFLLGVGLFLIVALIALIWLAPVPFSDSGPPLRLPFGQRVPGSLFLDAVALAGAMVGFGWMIRIFRGPSTTEPPAARYRTDPKA